MSDQHQLNVNDLVLSSNFGLGKIVSFENMGDGEQKFAVIESLEKKVKLMAPVGESLSFRKLSSAEELTSKLEQLKNLDGKKDFGSKKDRITYFKAQSHKQDLDTILLTIAQLRELQDRGSVENKIYTTLLNSVKLEVSTVMQLETEKADQLVDTSL